MTRTEAVTAIIAHLNKLEDEEVHALAGYLEGLADDEPIRALTPEEETLVEQSKEDFRLGRTFTPDEAHAFVDQGLARRRATRAKV